jgi:serine/threonine-protein kinase RsbW
VSEGSAITPSATTDDVRDRVEVRLPADGAYLSILRTATAGLAARLDFTLDEIEDLRIAVDEACAMLLGHTVAGAELACGFELTGDAMEVSVTVPTTDGTLPRQGTFAWTVLSTLADDVSASADHDLRVTITLRKQRGGPVPA